MKLFEWLLEYYEVRQKQGERLGQAFVNDFIKNPWPELFYATDDEKSMKMIHEWLKDCQYYDSLPVKGRGNQNAKQN